ncbi:TPA: hypothetical protein KKX58_001696 [Legionella pneumophila]|nr:hypothetical protein [Legionella pneumophila]HBD9405566.1 hypothetical protein [Legionella pneumophila]HBI2968796.1 hypothetical protein [Legionella pneumophila]
MNLSSMGPLAQFTIRTTYLILVIFRRRLQYSGVLFNRIAKKAMQFDKMDKH